jgi:hypothetical protein
LIAAVFSCESLFDDVEVKRNLTGRVKLLKFAPLELLVVKRPAWPEDE